MNDCITFEELWQEAKRWHMKRTRALKVADLYRDLGFDRYAERIDDCGTDLVFMKPDTGDQKLVEANFCRVRLCPMCIWRRTLKVAAQVSEVMDHVGFGGKREFIFWTLTIRNVPMDELGQALDELAAAWNRLMLCKPVRDMNDGWYKTIEVTYNSETREFHPHYHVILAVKPSYFKSRGYLSHDALMALWKRSMRLNYDPWVDTRRVRPGKDGTLRKAVSEVAKYTIKDREYSGLYMPNGKEVLAALTEELDHRRMMAFGGCMKETSRALKQAKLGEGNLVNLDDSGNVIREDVAAVIFRFRWAISGGVGAWWLVDQRPFDPDRK